MCATCPFRAGSQHAYLQDALIMSALKDASRICHSTGPPNAVYTKPPDKEAKICRGTRDIQLRWLTHSGFLKAPTDAAWAKKWKEIECQKRRKTG